MGNQLNCIAAPKDRHHDPYVSTDSLSQPLIELKDREEELPVPRNYDSHCKDLLEGEGQQWWLASGARLKAEHSEITYAQYAASNPASWISQQIDRDMDRVGSQPVTTSSDVDLTRSCL